MENIKIEETRKEIIQMAKDIASVRKTGRTNMYDRIAVIEILNEIEAYDTADYIAECKDEYMELLILSGGY